MYSFVLFTYTHTLTNTHTHTHKTQVPQVSGERNNVSENAERTEKLETCQLSLPPPPQILSSLLNHFHLLSFDSFGLLNTYIYSYFL